MECFIEALNSMISYLIVNCLPKEVYSTSIYILLIDWRGWSSVTKIHVSQCRVDQLYMFRHLLQPVAIFQVTCEFLFCRSSRP